MAALNHTINQVVFSGTIVLINHVKTSLAYEVCMNYIAVDVGGTQLRAALYPESGMEASAIRSISTKGEGKAIDRLLDLIASIWPDDHQVARIGLGIAGMVDPAKGVIYKAPNIDDWDYLPIVEIVQKRFQTPTVLGNDANVAALGEWKFGAGVGHHDLIYLTISTGVGSGIISNDRLIVGSHGIGAELGHVTVLPDGPMCGCGCRGHLEAISSGPSIARYVKEKINEGRESILAHESTPLNARMVSDAAQHGDELCIEAFHYAGEFLGRSIADMLHVFNPTIVILGGGVVKSGKLLIDPVMRSLEKNVLSPEYLKDFVLTTAKLGDQVGLVGALVLARG